MKVLLLLVPFLMAAQVATTSSAWAVDEDVTVKKKPEAEKIATSDKKVVEEDSSEYNRMGKTFLLDAQLLGIGPNWSSGWGIQAGYFLDRNDIVMLDFTDATLSKRIYHGNNNDSDQIDDDAFDIKTQSVGVHLKHFFGNSFYIKGGLDYRWIDFKYDFLTVAKFKSRSFGATINIGNQWQWETFNIGCDWVGLTVPFGATISNEVPPDTNFYSYDDYKRDRDFIAKKPVLNLLRFYLGVAF